MDRANLPGFFILCHKCSVSEKRIPESLPMQHRFFAVRASASEAESNSVPLSFSSDSPVQRSSWGGYWWNEILGHDAGEVRTGRLDQGLTLLVNHDMDQRAGRLENGSIDGSTGRGDAVFGTTDFARTIRQEVSDQTLRYVSVGYIVYNMSRIEDANPKDDEDEDYLGTYRVSDWEPVEVSLVAVPADPSVGVGRSADTYPCRGLHSKVLTPPVGDNKGARAMADKNPAEPTSPVNEVETRQKERSRVREIEALHSRYAGQLTREQADKFINDETPVEEVQRHVLSARQEDARANAVPTVQFVTDEHDKREKGITLARCVRAFAATKGDRQEAAKYAQERFGDPIAARALSASSAVGGGFLVPETMAAEVIEVLRPSAVVRSLNPVEVPLPNGSLTLPKLTAGTAATYIGENQNMPKTENKFGATKLTAKKLAALVPISNDLIRFQSISSDQIVRDDLAAAIAQREDLAFIRDQGSQYTPKGLRYQSVPANVQAAIALAGNPTGDIAAVTQSLGLQRLALRRANVPFRRPGRILSPRTEYFLMNVLTVNGTYAFRDEMLTGKLFGDPYKVTTQIPENLGGDGKQSEIYYADFADVLIGQVPTMVMETSTEATYWDGTQLQSAFSLDQTVIKVILEHDLGVRHGESVHILTGVEWGS